MRVFCSTNRCTLLAAQHGHDAQALASLRWERDALTAQVGALAADNARLRAELAAARADAAFYMGLFCDAREEADRPQNAARTPVAARNGA